MLNRALMSSDTREWNTPPAILEPVGRLDAIGLDPCGNATSIVAARREYRLDRGEDGLCLPWSGFGLVYCNPPYGRGIGAWLARAAGQWLDCGVESIVLVPARTDARWWQDNIRLALVCFWRGRLKFLGAPSSAPFPSAVLYHGHRPQRFREVFAPLGWIP